MTDLPMGNFIVVPFNVADALKAAEFAEILQAAQTGETGSRDNLKDDVKILAQADMKQSGFLITEDRTTMAKYCEKLTNSKRTSVQIIKSSEGFQESHFNGGQTDLFDKISEKKDK